MENFPHIQKTPKNEEDWMGVLLALARYLRSPQGCPWDRRQTARNFAAFAEEEARELIEALDEGDDEDVAEEFGDTLFTLLASAVCAEEEGRFKLLDALRDAHEKMVRRHGHVFGDDRAQTPEEAVASWEKIKEEEKRRKRARKGQ